MEQTTLIETESVNPFFSIFYFDVYVQLFNDLKRKSVAVQMYSENLQTRTCTAGTVS